MPTEKYRETCTPLISSQAATHMRYMRGGLEADRKTMWAYFKANGGSVGTSISAAKTPEEAASKRPKTSRPGSWLAFATLLPTRSHRRNACVSRTRCGPARPAPPDLKKSSEIKFGGIFSTTLLALLPGGMGSPPEGEPCILYYSSRVAPSRERSLLL